MYTVYIIELYTVFHHFSEVFSHRWGNAIYYNFPSENIEIYVVSLKDRCGYAFSLKFEIILTIYSAKIGGLCIQF